MVEAQLIWVFAGFHCHFIVLLVLQLIFLYSLRIKIFEPPHDKTNNVTEHPAKTQISLGIRPAAWAFAQSDLSLRCALNG